MFPQAQNFGNQKLLLLLHPFSSSSFLLSYLLSLPFWDTSVTFCLLQDKVQVAWHAFKVIPLPLLPHLPQLFASCVVLAPRSPPHASAVFCSALAWMLLFLYLVNLYPSVHSAVVSSRETLLTPLCVLCHPEPSSPYQGTYQFIKCSLTGLSSPPEGELPASTARACSLSYHKYLVHGRY